MLAASAEAGSVEDVSKNDLELQTILVAESHGDEHGTKKCIHNDICREAAVPICSIEIVICASSFAECLEEDEPAESKLVPEGDIITKRRTGSADQEDAITISQGSISRCRGLDDAEFGARVDYLEIAVSGEFRAASTLRDYRSVRDLEAEAQSR
jgi:hypothetical protein